MWVESRSFHSPAQCKALGQPRHSPGKTWFCDLPRAQGSIRKYTFKKKYHVSLDDFCSCVSFQCSLGRLFEGSALLLRSGPGAFIISWQCLPLGCSDWHSAHREGSVNSWQCASNSEVKPFHIGKYRAARRSPYVVRHAMLMTEQIRKLQYGPVSRFLWEGTS